MAHNISKKKMAVYSAGLLMMSLGIVLLKKADLGVSPLNSLPSAVANLTPLTFGNTQTLFQLLCVLAQVLLLRRITAAVIFQLPLSVVFGWLVDLYMALLSFTLDNWLLQGAVCLLGILFTALGIVFIVSVDMVLPPQDALFHLVSRLSGWPLGRAKLLGDFLWTVCSAAIEWFALGSILSVGIGTAASVLLTGNLVTLLRKRFFSGEKTS